MEIIPMYWNDEHDANDQASSNQEDQGNVTGNVASHNLMMALFNRLDNDLNNFSARVKVRQIFTGALSKRLVDLGRKLDSLKPIIKHLGTRIDHGEPQTRQRIWNQVTHVAKSLGLTSSKTESTQNETSMDVVQFNAMGLERIGTLEAKYERLELVKVRAMSLLRQKPGPKPASSTLAQSGTTVPAFQAKTNKVMVVGDMFYELIEHLRKCTAYCVWSLPHVSMKSMEIIIAHETKEQHANLEDIFLFVGKMDIRNQRKASNVLNDLYSLLVAVRAVYGSAVRISVCQGPDMVGMTFEERRVCYKLGVRCVNVFPDGIMPSRDLLVDYVTQSISMAH